MKAVLLFLAPYMMLLKLVRSVGNVLRNVKGPVVPIVTLIMNVVSGVIVDCALATVPSVGMLNSTVNAMSTCFVTILVRLTYVGGTVKMGFPVGRFVVEPLVAIVAVFVTIGLDCTFVTNLVNKGLTALVSVTVNKMICKLILVKVNNVGGRRVLAVPGKGGVCAMLEGLGLVGWWVRCVCGWEGCLWVIGFLCLFCGGGFVVEGAGRR